MKFRRFWCSIFPFTYSISVAIASPTPNEYERCHRMASSVLVMCLDKNAGSAGKKCWDAARRRNDACYADVRESHSRPDRQRRIDAERHAREQAKEQAKMPR